MDTTGRSVTIMSLPDEILMDILRFIDPDPEPPKIDQRAFMSAVSFRQEPEFNCIHDVMTFRTLCHRFGIIGRRHLFRRLHIRFTEKGFEKLRAIASNTEVAHVVEKMTYLIPRFFFRDRDQLNRFSASITPSAAQSREVKQLVEKSNQQIKLLESEEDIMSLEVAFSAFKSLIHARLRRVEDKTDRDFLRFLRRHPEIAASHGDSSWAGSYLHGAKTLVQAFEFSTSQDARRLSFLRADVQSTMSLRYEPPSSLIMMTARLESLILDFDNSKSFEHHLVQLSPLFHALLNAATNMAAIHIGFPFPGRPVSVALEDVFQNIHLKKLRVLSLTGWRLSGKEIERITYRHRSTLCGLRLRGVLLKKGSMWIKVLTKLRNTIPNLRWLSLSGAGYDDDGQQPMGFTESDSEAQEFNDSSDSDIADSFGDSDEGDIEFPELEMISPVGESEDESIPSVSDHGSISDLSAVSEDMNMRSTGSIGTKLCICDTGTVEPDNGRTISSAQRRIWEAWVTFERCPMHGIPSPLIGRQQSVESNDE